MKTVFLCWLAAASLPAAAQDSPRYRVTVPVSNSSRQPAENATVELLRAADTSLVKTALTGSDGMAELESIREGNYLLRVSQVNHETVLSAPLTVSGGNLQAPGIVLQPRATDLKTVTVTSRKPFLQKLSDRIVVNVENSLISAGNTAQDVLERSPGVNIDQNDVISLRGKSGVIIMIDGKPSPMNGSDLAAYLKGLPASAIERIDIITNPSARYDAAGNAGIIDIRLRKDQRYGTNGSLNAGYGQGIYSKTQAGATFNYRNKQVNVFGNYNYAYRIGLNHLLLDRSFYENGQYHGGDLKDNYSKSPSSTHTARFGADFFPSANTIIGFVVNGNFNHYTRKNDNRSIVLDPSREASSTFNSFASNNDHNNNAVFNINLKHSFGKSGRELTADADYGTYRSRSLTLNATRYFKLDGSPLQPGYTLQGDQRGNLSFRTAKTDYVQPLGKNSRLETGAKTSFVQSDNDARFYDVSTGTAVNDSNKTNHFLYKEHNHAGYLNLKTTAGKWELQAGLRGEYTHINTWQEMGDRRFDSAYFQLFPSLFVHYKAGEEQTLGASVSRRIDRPGYGQLNPFLFLIDVTTYSTGRPGLLPQLTWAYELSYTRKNLSFSLNYSHTVNNQNITLARFKEVFPHIPSPDNVTVQIPINLQSSDYFGLTVTAPVRISKWWNMVNNANLYYEKFNGRFSGTSLNKGRPAADLRTNNSFTLPKGWTAELNATLNTGGQYGFMVMDPVWSLSAGIQKTVLNSKGTIRFNVTDIFWTNLPKAVITFSNYVEKWHAYRETRVGTLSFTYRFGSSKVQGARRRTTASEEERQRAQ